MDNTILAMLIKESVEGDDRLIPLLQPQIKLGRDETNDIVIIDHLTSRFHAQIQCEGKNFILIDLKSTNGTWVNGKRIIEYRLKDGDEIQVGQASYRFTIPDVRNKKLDDLLYPIQLFANLSDETWKEITHEAEYQFFPAKSTLATIDLNDSLCVILFGELSVKQPPKNGKEPGVRKYVSGQYFDSMHLNQNLDISSIEILEPTWLLILNRDKVNSLITPLLRGLYFFDSLDDNQLQAIVQRANLECYEEGETLFNQDDLADALYIVIYGKVAMVKFSDQDGQVIWDEIRGYERGDLFGELGLLVDQPRAATGKIKEKTGLLILPKSKFQELVNEFPNIILNLYRYIARLLEEQSVAFWHAAQDIERMKGLIQSTKMAALGQLVAGIAHEINTPVGSISSNSSQLKDIIGEIKEYFDEFPNLSDKFYKDDALRKTAEKLGLKLDAPTKKIVQRLASEQLRSIQDYYENVGMDMLFGDTEEISKELNDASKRITDMVRSLASFTRLDEANRKTVDIHEGLDATLSLLRHELKYKVEVERDYNRNLPKITCYPNQLNQVFMNILMNAIQALDLDKLEMGKKGKITVKTDWEDRWLVVAISDNGKGIRPEDRSKIFEPFFSTKGAAAAAGGLGLGLGLSISQKIVEEKHGGEIALESEVGKGTTFYIKLPLDKPGAMKLAQITTQTVLEKGRMKKITDRDIEIIERKENSE